MAMLGKVDGRDNTLFQSAESAIGAVAAGAPRARSAADPDAIRAQVDRLGVPWLMIGFQSAATPNAGRWARGFQEP